MLCQYCWNCGKLPSDCHTIMIQPTWRNEWKLEFEFKFKLEPKNSSKVWISFSIRLLNFRRICLFKILKARRFFSIASKHLENEKCAQVCTPTGTCAFQGVAKLTFQPNQTDRHDDIFNESKRNTILDCAIPAKIVSTNTRRWRRPLTFPYPRTALS